MPVETLRPSGPLGGGGGPSPFTSGMPFRILNKGPDYFRRGPAGCLELCSNHNNNGGGTRKMSAVERLEADKAKYVKSQQVALNRQEPVKPPIIRKPLMSPGMMLQCRISTPPARKVPRRPLAHADAENGGGGGEGGIFGSRRGPHLNLEILNNLINVCDGPMVTTPSSSPSPVPSSPSPSASSPSPSSGCKRPGTVTCTLEPQQQQQQQQHPLPSSTITAPSSSPLNGHIMDRRPPPVPARAPRVPTAYSSPNTVTVRRVDVRPQAAEVRKPPRIPLQPPPHPHHHHPHRKPRQIAQPQAPPSLPPPPPPPIAGTTATNTTTTSTSNSTSCPSPSPASLPATLPSQQQHPPAPSPVGKPPASPLLLRASPVGGAVVMMPPASPAVTRISSTSSRGSRHGGKHGAHHHPSLHRSKSDLSDRYSRATADLERFFNYCGLDPEEVEGMGGVERFARAASDIISVSKLRSVSTPSSECGDYHNGRHGGGRGGEEEYEEEEEEDEGPPRPNERVPYSISVIERNARVIKWLYGIRQARDTSQNNVSNV